MKKPAAPVAALITGGMLAVGISGAGGLTDDGPLTYLLLLLMCLATAVPFLVAIRRSRFQFLELIYPLSIFYFLGFVVRTLYIMSFPTRLMQYEVGKAIAVSLGALGGAQLNALAGFATMLLGYYSSLGRRVARCLPEWKDLRRPLKGQQCITRTMLVSAVGFIFVLMRASVSDIGRFQGAAPQVSPWAHLISLFTVAAYISVLLYITYWAQNGRAGGRVLPFVVVSATTLFVADLTSGLRGSVIRLCVMMFICYYAAKRRSPSLRVATFGASIVATILLLTMPVTSEFRRQLAANPTSEGVGVAYLQRRVDAIVSSVVVVASGQATGDDTSSTSMLDDILFRLRGIDPLMIAIHRTPNEQPYLWGDTYITFFQAFIPRFLWADKPVTTFGRDFNLKYIGVSSSTPGSAAVGPLTELYINFSTWGVVFGMFIFGVVYRSVYEYAIVRHGQGPGGVILYALVGLTLIDIENTAGALFAEIVMTLVILAVILRFVLAGEKHRVRATPKIYVLLPAR